jgi:hypothetical protein
MASNYKYLAINSKGKTFLTTTMAEAKEIAKNGGKIQRLSKAEAGPAAKKAVRRSTPRKK